MEDNNKPKLYARLRVKTGEYESDGKMKNRYAEIGVLFASPHFSNMYMNIDTLPISKDWDGRIYVNPIETPKVDSDDYADSKTRDKDVIAAIHEFENKGHSQTHEFNKTMVQDNLPTDEEVDGKIDLSQIPF